MKLLKEYGPGVAALLVVGLAKHFWGEKGLLVAVILLVIAAMAACAIVLFGSRRKYRHCPKCGCGTEMGWHTDKIDVRGKRIKMCSEWYRGVSATQKTAVIRCPGCGWETRLGK